MEKRKLRKGNLAKAILYPIILAIVCIYTAMKGLDTYGEILDLLEQTGISFSILHLKMYAYDIISICSFFGIFAWINYVYNWINRGEYDLIDLLMDKGII